MVLGPTKVSQFLLDAFLDYISSAERRVFQNALKFNDANRFPQDIQHTLLNIIEIWWCYLMLILLAKNVYSAILLQWWILMSCDLYHWK